MAETEAAAPTPSGWTTIITAKDRVEAMLTASTNLPFIQVKLQEIDGSMYVFQSGSNYYFWNSVNEEGGRVTDPRGYDALLRQMDRDITKVQVDPL